MPPTWEADYQHDRRKHRHRCCCCQRIIEAGERVLMAKVGGRRSRAIHIYCAAKPHGTGGRWTYRDAMEAWGTDYLKKIGFAVPDHPMNKVGSDLSEVL